MRKVKVTKQQTVNPKAVYMGLSIAQIITMVIGIAIALGIVGLFIFVLGISVNLTMTVKWIYVIFKSPIFRPYKSKGPLDTYVKEEKE